MLTLYNTSLFGHCVISAPQLRSGQATHLSVQFNCLISPPKNCSYHRSDLYLLVCVFPSPSSDFSGRLKLLYYSPRVCQIPQQLQTHHLSLALCLRGNKVSEFPGWQICVIVLRPGWGNNSVDTGGESRGEKDGERRAMGERERERGWRISLPFKVKIEFLWRGAPQVVKVRDLSLWNLKRRKSLFRSSPRSSVLSRTESKKTAAFTLKVPSDFSNCADQLYVVRFMVGSDKIILVYFISFTSHCMCRAERESRYLWLF